MFAVQIIVSTIANTFNPFARFEVQAFILGVSQKSSHVIVEWDLDSVTKTIQIFNKPDSENKNLISKLVLNPNQILRLLESCNSVPVFTISKVYNFVIKAINKYVLQKL